MKLAASVVAVALALAVVAPAFAQQPPAPSLYKRLGGYDAMAAVTDDFLRRLTSDPSFARFFTGHSTDSLKKIRQLVVERYDWSAVAQDFEDALARVATGSSVLFPVTRGGEAPVPILSQGAHLT